MQAATNKSIYLCASDVSELAELVSESFIVYAVVKVLHVQIDAVISSDLLQLEWVKFVAQFRLAFGFLLSAPNVQFTTPDILTVQLLYGLHTPTI